MKNHLRRVVCQICKQSKPLSEAVPAELVRQPIVELITKTYPDWAPESFICLTDLHRLRADYFEDLVQADKGELSTLEAEVIRSLQAEEDLLSENINVEFDRRLTVGEHVADKVAEFGGSWRFILGFTTVLAVWIVLNTVRLWQQPFDPYPYILLNLLLSCLAAVQAPIIMMSQNRQEAKDRLRAEHDYRVNLKAELEIRHIIAKLDQLVTHQWQRLLEVQRLQLELLHEREEKAGRGNMSRPQRAAKARDTVKGMD
ncbi:MAG: DUF1003 domain-containing protein [Candidatus Binatia bacterium]